MPELPEVEAVRRWLASAICHKQIQAVDIAPSKRHRGVDYDGLDALISNSIEKVSRRGKYLILHAKSYGTMIVHLGMSGRFVARPRSDGHDVFSLVFDDGVVITYNDFR